MDSIMGEWECWKARFQRDMYGYKSANSRTPADHQVLYIHWKRFFLSIENTVLFALSLQNYWFSLPGFTAAQKEKHTKIPRLVPKTTGVIRSGYSPPVPCCQSTSKDKRCWEQRHPGNTAAFPAQKWHSSGPVNFYSFSKCLMSTHYVQGIGLGAAVFEMTKLYM